MLLFSHLSLIFESSVQPGVSIILVFRLLLDNVIIYLTLLKSQMKV